LLLLLLLLLLQFSQQLFRSFYGRRLLLLVRLLRLFGLIGLFRLNFFFRRLAIRCGLAIIHLFRTLVLDVRHLLQVLVWRWIYRSLRWWSIAGSRHQHNLLQSRGLGRRAEQHVVEMRAVQQLRNHVARSSGAELSNHAFAGNRRHVHCCTGFLAHGIEHIRHGGIPRHDRELSALKVNVWRRRRTVFGRNSWLGSLRLWKLRLRRRSLSLGGDRRR